MRTGTKLVVQPLRPSSSVAGQRAYYAIKVTTMSDGWRAGRGKLRNQRALYAA